MSDGNDADIKIHKILEIYTKLYQATGGVVEFEKTSYFCWRQKRQNGKFSIQNKIIKIEVNNQIIQQLNIKEATRTLGIYMIPLNTWIKQILIMKEKMSLAIGKLNNTKLQTNLIYLYFNAYLLKNIFFGTGIV